MPFSLDDDSPSMLRLPLDGVAWLGVLFFLHLVFSFLIWTKFKTRRNMDGLELKGKVGKETKEQS